MSDDVRRRVLLVDGMNIFARYYAAHPAMSDLGEHMGGFVGFMYALRRQVERDDPSMAVVVWEGGGSMRRRQLYPQYKQQRKPVRMNRFYGDDIPDSDENRDQQLKSVIRCLRYVPVYQVYVGDCEADDVIAYMCRTRFKRDEKIIMSSDKDYYQLLDDLTRIYRPGRKVYVAVDDVMNEYKISPENFALAKAVVGDKSDNIVGVKGVGFKTLAKRFPELSSRDERWDVSRLVAEASERSKVSKVKLYDVVARSRDDILRNFRLVDLDGSMLTPEHVRSVDHIMDTYELKRDKIGLIRELVSLGMQSFHVDQFFYTMLSLYDKPRRSST